MPNDKGRPESRGLRSERWRSFVLVAAAFMLGVNPRVLRAQAPVAADSQALSVYLMTMGPGDAVWERFGHNAIRIRNSQTGEDRAYNWGMFSLDDTGFILRFLRGRMRYWMASEDAQLTVNAYHAYNRSVTIQELNFTGVQKLALLEFVRRNELPENRFYDYDYFLDNCSTRVRDALDMALGGVLAQRFKSASTAYTYRDHALRLMQPDILTFTGIDIGLGRKTDRPISAWEEMFIPMSLQRVIRDVRVNGSNGESVPLVLSERVVTESTRPPVAAEPPRWVFGFLLVGVLLGGVIVACALTRATPVATVLTVGWSMLCGLFGTLLVLLWVATEHVAAHQNANVLALNPVWFVLAWFVVARARRVTPLAATLVAAAGASLLLSLLSDHQDTSRVMALVLPVHAAAAFAIARRARRT